VGQSSDESSIDRDRAIFLDLHASLRRFAAVIGAPDEDPDDLVQEALTRALRRMPLHELQNPGAYLRQTIVRLEINRRRSMERHERALRRLNGTEASSPVYPSDLDLLRSLSADERAAVYLLVVEQRSAEQVGILLGTSTAAVRKRVSRALRRLNVVLQEEVRRA
jgi:RNA polymerase sigma factor (sigma-70 family)